MLAAFLRQTACGLLSKFAIVFCCQQIQDKDEVAYQCCKLWRSISAYKDAKLESQMFYNFFNQVYGNEVLEFYFRVSALVTSTYSFEKRWSNTSSGTRRSPHSR